MTAARSPLETAIFLGMTGDEPQDGRYTGHLVVLNALDGICHRRHITAVWTVELAPEFEPELPALPAEVRIELLAQARVVERFGPTAGRPRVDTLNGSKHANIPDLRLDAEPASGACLGFDPSL